MDIYDKIKPGLFMLPPETASKAVHNVLWAIQDTPFAEWLSQRYTVADHRLQQSIFGLDFPTPVGVAAGFDKNGEIPRILSQLGFGHIEIGGITAKPQPGNSRPRLFRLTEDEALINRMGFNNEGADRVGDRLRHEPKPEVPVGINIGKSKSTPIEDAAEDYLYTYERVSKTGDYFVVNVSSPNTPGLRSLQNRESLEDILGTLKKAGAQPLLVKFSPDLANSAVEDALSVINELDLDGIIATNTTTKRPDSLRNPNKSEDGGLSGTPIEEDATNQIRFIAERTDIPIIGVGGVSDPAGAYKKIRAGASLVQLYTGFVFNGPCIARDINEGLLELLERDGFDSVEEAVGVDV